MNDFPAGQEATYYGLPAVKPSLWHGLVSSYMFVSGIGGSAQIIASLADLLEDRALTSIVRNGRYIALASALAGGPLLIIDLHTPRRWYNMLRIFRKTSPMSIGTWVLMSFGSLSAVLAGAQFASDRGHAPSGMVGGTIKLLQIPAALSGMAMTTYTGSLLSATSTPLWAAAPRTIAASFGAAAMASGAATLRIAERRQAAPDGASRVLDRIGFMASAAELVLMICLRQQLQRRGVGGALRETAWGFAYDIGAVGLGAGVPILHYAQRARQSEHAPRSMLLISLAVLAGGFLLRHILIEAGNASTKRPRDYFRFASSNSASRKALR
jgi:formate-dependent nitrite reductase membrane component NrfD